MKTTVPLLLASSALIIAGCSDDLTAEEEIAQIEAGRERAAEAEGDTASASASMSVEERYQRAVECSATAVNVSNIFDVIASTDEDSNPDAAARARTNAQNNLEEARTFADVAESLGANPEIGKSRETVLADIAVVDREIRQRGMDSGDFMEFSRTLAREADQCDTDLAALQ